MSSLLGAAFALLAAIVGIIALIVVVPIALVVVTFSAGTAAPPGHVPEAAAMPVLGPLPTSGMGLEALIAPWYGSRYVFGGNVIGAVDCSGFTVAVYRQLGVNLPRTAQTQYNVARKVTDPQPGDMVFFFGTYDSRPDFISHVGIYLGDGMMASAVEPTLGRQSLSSPYWRSKFVSFGRVLGA